MDIYDTEEYTEIRTDEIKYNNTTYYVEIILYYIIGDENDGYCKDYTDFAISRIETEDDEGYRTKLNTIPDFILNRYNKWGA